jgi:predicted dehydrogenase
VSHTSKRSRWREMNGSDEISVAVVGLGYWGPNRLRALTETQGTRISYICDLDEERLARYARRFSESAATTEFQRILEDPSVDAVVIATPVFTHHELAAASLESEKHTFVEKPLAPSADKAEELLALADRFDRVLMCGHTFLYSPPVRVIKDLLDREELGDLYFMSSSRVNLGLHQRDVSVIWDLAPHDFSILLYWLDSLPEWVSAVGRDSVVKGVPDVAFIDVKFATGLLSHTELSWLAPSKLRRTVIVGSEKMIVYEDGSPEPVRIFDSGVIYRDPESFGEYYLSYRTGDIVSPRVDTTEPIVTELADFVAAVREGMSPVSTPQRAVDVIRLIEAAETSLANDGARISMESPVGART